MPQRRDRRDDGRPEQTRPRDRSGRPLPYGTHDVPLAEEHDPRTVEESLRLGAELWDQQRFFEAHECLENVWHAAPRGDRDLWQGVIQVAVAEVHRQRGNPSGALTLYRRAAERLRGYPDEHRGIDVTAALRHCERAQEAVRSGGDDATVPPLSFPAVVTGAWFTDDPARLSPTGGPTAVPEEPVWLAEGERRAPQRRADQPPDLPPRPAPDQDR